MRINFVGDVGVFRGFEESGIDPFRLVVLPEADLNIANFEFIIPRNPRHFFYDVQSHYSCSYPYLEKLSFERFDGFSLANNHSLDYGPEGASDVINLLESRGVKVFGFSSDPAYTMGSFEKNGIKTGIIAFVKEGRWSKKKHGFGPDAYDVEKICALISECREQYDHIIIYPHWGTELVEVPDPGDTQNARRFIDAGATAVIGHHPHISQGIEAYSHGVIAYSLGSFIYIPEHELGYTSKDKNREISICFQLNLQKDHLDSYEAHYYRYDTDALIPGPIQAEEIRDYAAYLDAHIHDRNMYNRQIRQKLVRRECRSFWQRFKSHPLRTIGNYIQFLKPSKLKKLVH